MIVEVKPPGVFKRCPFVFFIFLDLGIGMHTGRSGNRLAEILHIDTEDSQRFFMEHRATNPEKCDCQKALEDAFTLCCRTFGGRVRTPTEGDGAIAFFDGLKFNGGAVLAAEKFIAELPQLHKQTETLLPGRKVRPRRFRIKAHRGSIYFDKSGRREASSPDVIDSLVKHEKQIAPLTDQLYITEELLTNLEPKLKERFVPATRRRYFGNLRTIIYRLKTEPQAFHELPPVGGKRTDDITPEELELLKQLLNIQLLLMSARDKVTTGVTARVTTRKRPLRSSDLVEATLEGIHLFLVTAFADVTDKFNVTFWQPNSAAKPTHLKKQYGYPRRGPDRRVSLRQNKFQLVRSFIECTAIFHEDVRASAAKGEWSYFDPRQGNHHRNLCSTVQFPVYRTKNAMGEPIRREVLGVLSVDTNCPDFFHPEDAAVWISRMRGFLVNLALSQKL